MRCAFACKPALTLFAALCCAAAALAKEGCIPVYLDEETARG
jgi:hypothetical protein